jgi:hypothetical protein
MINNAIYSSSSEVGVEPPPYLLVSGNRNIPEDSGVSIQPSSQGGLCVTAQCEY